MKIVLKILAGVAVALLTILYGVCKFVLLLAGFVLGILSLIVAILGVAILILVDPVGGVAFLVIAFAISPFGLPRLAAFLVGVIGGASYALRDFIAS